MPDFFFSLGDKCSFLPYNFYFFFLIYAYTLQYLILIWICRHYFYTLSYISLFSKTDFLKITFLVMKDTFL